MGYSGETSRGTHFEKCEWCGRFGAKKYVDDAGPNGRGGRNTATRWLCDKCEDEFRKNTFERSQKNQAQPRE